MPGYASSFEAAPLDRTARLVTRSVWVLAIAFAVAGVLVAAVGSAWSGVPMLAVGALLLATMAWMRRIEPRSYDVGDGALHVHRRFASPSSFSGPIEACPSWQASGSASSVTGAGTAIWAAIERTAGPFAHS